MTTHDSDEGATIIAFRPQLIQPDISDQVFRDSLASTLTLAEGHTRQELLDAVREHVHRRAEMRRHLEAVAEMLRDDDVAGAQRHLLDVLEEVRLG